MCTSMVCYLMYCNKLFPNIKSQMIKIANCTDKILNDFIENIFKADKDKNNLVIVHSDHLLMNSIKKILISKEKIYFLLLIHTK